MAKLILKEKGVTVSAVISNVGGVADPTPEQVEEIVLAAKGDLDSVGGAIRCTVDGLPAGERVDLEELGRLLERVSGQGTPISPQELLHVQQLVGMLNVQAKVGVQTSQQTTQGLEGLLRQSG